MDSFFKRKIDLKVGDSFLRAKLFDARNGLYVLLEEFQYHIRYRGRSYTFTIPAGFITNFASVPKPFWRFFHPVENKMLVASCVHDFILNEFYKRQPFLTRTIQVDGNSTEISDCIDGFLAADLFFFSLSQEGSYNLPVRQFLRLCVKGWHFCTLKGWIPVK